MTKHYELQKKSKGINRWKTVGFSRDENTIMFAFKRALSSEGFASNVVSKAVEYMYEGVKLPNGDVIRVIETHKPIPTKKEQEERIIVDLDRT